MPWGALFQGQRMRWTLDRKLLWVPRSGWVLRRRENSIPCRNLNPYPSLSARSFIIVLNGSCRLTKNGKICVAPLFRPILRLFQGGLSYRRTEHGCSMVQKTCIRRDIL